jgi:lipoprotein-releasing system ATP-binding protein
MLELALSARDIRKSYPTRAAPLEVLRSVNIALSPGEALVIMGPSGSGKSTLLSILGTLETPDSGDLRIAGQNPFSLKPPELAHFRNRHVGFVFQDHHLLPQLSLLENVLVPTLAEKGRASKTPERALVQTRAAKLLDDLGLTDRQEHPPAELSGGERQRGAIARALIYQPALVLADEPTGNLDRKTAERIGDLLAAVTRHENAALIVVTHSPQLAERFSRRVELIDGELTPL